jgi:hypothetical protein
MWQVSLAFLAERRVLMGKASRERPARLGEKLLQIRLALGLSQSGMLHRLGINERSYWNYGYDVPASKRFRAKAQTSRQRLSVAKRVERKLCSQKVVFAESCVAESCVRKKVVVCG